MGTPTAYPICGERPPDRHPWQSFCVCNLAPGHEGEHYDSTIDLVWGGEGAWLR